jgi:hypothetical protein
MIWIPQAKRNLRRLLMLSLFRMSRQVPAPRVVSTTTVWRISACRRLIYSSDSLCSNIRRSTIRQSSGLSWLAYQLGVSGTSGRSRSCRIRNVHWRMTGTLQAMLLLILEKPKSIQYTSMAPKARTVSCIETTILSQCSGHPVQRRYPRITYAILEYPVGNIPIGILARLS